MHWKVAGTSGFTGPNVGRIGRTCIGLLILLVCALTTLPGLGQNIVVSEEVMLKDDLAYEVFGVPGRTILFRDRGNDYEIRTYDDAMQPRQERVLEWEKRNTDLISISPGDTVFHVVYGYRLKGDYIVMHRVYDVDLHLLDTTVVHIDEKDYFSPRYLSSVSEDKSKLLLYQAEKEDVVSIIVYDLKTREVLLKRTVFADDTAVRRDVRQLLITDSGDVFVVFDQSRMGDRNRVFSVLRLDQDMSDARMTEVHLGDLTANDLNCAVDNVHHRLLMGGLFSERNGGRSLGLYLATVGIGDGQVQLRTVLFDEALLQSVYGKEVSLSKGVSDFVVQDMVLRQDGGVLMIAEMQKEYSRRPNMPGRRDFAYPRGGWTDYYYEDLMLFSIHPDGSEHWNAVLHKKQYSQDDEALYSSYFLFKTPEKLRLLFNDEIRQENMVSEFVVRGNGYFRRQSVFSTDYQRLRLRLRDAIQVSWNVCVVPSERNNRLSLVRITFDDNSLTFRQ